MKLNMDKTAIWVGCIIGAIVGVTIDLITRHPLFSWAIGSAFGVLCALTVALGPDKKC
jgi:uncharacterized membrane protein